ncbi:MAG TPA: microviridin/marinostatin family tricyclic proteinase inhibitor [Pyrinomonadaceae bacterium]|nr:microviridin/marinostatin family tricyclic proteinase inhibitor [Pyrinomonadaceae bacterium]
MEHPEKAKTETSHDDTPQGSETPFFARFLEGQHAEARPAGANDEAVFMTLKYPSDRDEIDRPLSHV